VAPRCGYAGYSYVIEHGNELSDRERVKIGL